MNRISRDFTHNYSENRGSTYRQPKSEFKPNSRYYNQSYELRYPCQVCGKSYLRKPLLKRHELYECIGIPPKFTCEYCPSRYRRNEDLKRHLYKVHNIITQKNISLKHSL
uniref:C2H2-type domain-containing protein n=1 Tax=Megaselia scalaris TaxID=36166 RepID=T1GDQ7_MEGSC